MSVRSATLLRLWRTTRTAQRPILAILAFAVFAWGLQYKVSVYQTETAQHSVLGAKLFSQKQRLTSGVQKQRSLRSGRPASAAGLRPFTTSASGLPTKAPALALSRFQRIARPLGRLEAPSPYLNSPQSRGPPITA